MEFIPFRNASYDCFQNNIISVILQYFNRNYFPAFWGEFDFSYINYVNSNMKYDDLWIHGCNDLEENILMDICGIKITKCRIMSDKEFKEIQSIPINYIYNNYKSLIIYERL